MSFLYVTRLILFYISTKYHKSIPRVSDLQSGHKINAKSLSNITKGDNAKSKKGRVTILVPDTPSHPILHFYQIPSKGIQVTERTQNQFQKQNKGRQLQK